VWPSAVRENTFDGSWLPVYEPQNLKPISVVLPPDPRLSRSETLKVGKEKKVATEVGFVTFQTPEGKALHMLLGEIVMVRPGENTNITDIMLKSGQTVTVKGQPLGIIRRIAKVQDTQKTAKSPDEGEAAG
jgi:hypothetical protein